MRIIKLESRESERLVLVLKRKWFDLWEQEIKPEDYRELTPRWLAILYGLKFTIQGKNARADQIYDWMLENKEHFMATYKAKPFQYIELNHAYSSNRPQCKSTFKGIEIRTGNKEWGAKKDRIYFCIIGEGIYDRKNIV